MKAAAAAAALSEGEADGELSPLPVPGGQLPRRRGGISAEPVTEEDATSYVKKVTLFCTNFILVYISVVSKN